MMANSLQLNPNLNKKLCFKMGRLFFMDISDKILVESENNSVCPPHYLPHKLHFGEPVTDEPCHFHEAWWRTLHHDRYCRKLKCPNYENMKKAYEEHQNQPNQE